MNLNLGDLQALHESLMPVWGMWRQFGVNLGLLQEALDAIEVASGQDETRFQMVLGSGMGATGINKINIRNALQNLGDQADFAGNWEAAYIPQVNG